MQRTKGAGSLSLYQGYLLSSDATERARSFIKARRNRMIHAEALARLIASEMRPVTPWAGCTESSAALAAARHLLWDASRRGELREMRGAWGHTYWMAVQ